VAGRVAVNKGQASNRALTAFLVLGGVVALVVVLVLLGSRRRPAPAPGGSSPSERAEGDRTGGAGPTATREDVGMNAPRLSPGDGHTAAEAISTGALPARGCSSGLGELKPVVQDLEAALGCLQHMENASTALRDILNGVVRFNATYSFSPIFLERPQQGSRSYQIRCPVCGQEVTILVNSRRAKQRSMCIALGIMAAIVLALGGALQVGSGGAGAMLAIGSVLVFIGLLFAPILYFTFRINPAAFDPPREAVRITADRQATTFPMFAQHCLRRVRQVSDAKPRPARVAPPAPAPGDTPITWEPPKPGRYLLVGIRESDGTRVERQMEGGDEEEVRAAAMLEGIDVLRVDRVEGGPPRQP
jgi:hypothetical protein